MKTNNKNEELEKLLLEKIKKYRKITKSVISNIKKRKNLTNEELEKAESLINYAKAYVRDSDYFESKDMLLEAFAALAYAHGIIDGGILAGLFEEVDYIPKKREKQS